MSEGIAVLGMACRYADADSARALWECVLARRQAFREVPAERLRVADYSGSGGGDADGIYPIRAAVLENYQFDRSRFRVSAELFAATDLTHWLALEVASDARDDSGLQLAPYTARTSVIVGNTLTGEFARAAQLRYRWPYVRRVLDPALQREGYDESRRQSFLQDLEITFKAPFPAPNEDSLAGGLSNTIAGRIANYYDLRGGAFTVDGACASSLLAVASGCLQLLAGEVDVVIAGGVDLSLDPFELVGFARNSALSKGTMRIFDTQSDGFWPGEGCGFVVLMRESDAIAAGRRIRASIRGWGLSTDGSGGLTRPTIAGQTAAMARAYARAGFDPGTVPLFEAHGTGTAVGDPIELSAIAKVRREAGATTPAVVGSVKANIGHTKAAAGVAGLIKAVMALDEQILPAVTGCDSPHSLFDEYADAICVSAQSRVWPRELPLRAGVSALGFGGINVHLALEGRAASRRVGIKGDERKLLAHRWDAELFMLSAEDRTELRARIEGLAALAPRLSGAECTDVAAVLARGPHTGACRAVVVASEPLELQRRLGLLLERVSGPMDRAIDPDNAFAFAEAGSPRILLLFPGQGTPCDSIGAGWRHTFDEVNELYARLNLTPASDRAATEIAQPAIATATLAGLAILTRFGIAGSVAVGHSLGEICALHWAGAFDSDTLIRLVSARGSIMGRDARTGGSMLRVSASMQQVNALIEGTEAVIACHNSPTQCVVSGAVSTLSNISARAREAGLYAQLLRVSHAFHSPYVEPATNAFEAFVALESIDPLRRPVVSTVTGAELSPNENLRLLLAKQIREPVRFAEAVQIASAGSDLMIEVGAGEVLTQLTRWTGVPGVALDIGGGSFRGLLFAVGAAFALGSPVTVEALHAGRFSRNFDLNRTRRFLANPCESVYPASAGAGIAMPVPESAAPRSPQMSQSGPGPSNSAACASRTSFEVLQAALARHLQLPLETIQSGHRLLGDLHLNSITVGQLVAEAARELGLQSPPGPTDFAGTTVGEAARALGGIGASSSHGHDLYPSGVDTWVRGFLPTLVPAAYSGGAAVAVDWQATFPHNHALGALLRSWSEKGPDARLGIAVFLPRNLDSTHLDSLLQAARLVTQGASGLLLVVQEDGGGGGFARSLSAEYPRWIVRVIDCPSADPRTPSWIKAEIVDSEVPFVEAHYGADGLRRLPTFILQDEGRDSQSGLVGPDDVILVSGGAKGIGAECALALGIQTGAALALVGRSSPDHSAVSASLTRFRERGVRASYAVADITNLASVTQAVGVLEKELGPITGLIHAAGINHPVSLTLLDRTTLGETVAVKVEGLRHLLAAVPHTQVRLVVAFSSILARLGLPGEAHYSLANEWLERSVGEWARSHPGSRCLSIGWSVWSGVGMGQSLGAIDGLARRGVVAIDIARATEIFVRLANTRIEANCVTVTGRVGASMMEHCGQRWEGSARFLETIPVCYPGVELIAQATVTADTDPYVRDHQLAGTPLFPAVLSIEALGQVANALLPGRAVQSLSSVEFLRPIGVPAAGTSLRIAAISRDRDRIEAVVRSSETGFQTDHVRAILECSTGSQLTDVATSPDSEQTVLDASVAYTHLLFHTGRFRRITDYSFLQATGCVANIRPAGPERWYPSRSNDDFAFGDPGARDAAIHALQACVPGSRLIPIAVSRICLGKLSPQNEYVVRGTQVERFADRIVFDVRINDGTGTCIELWERLVLKVLEPLPLPGVLPLPLLAPFLQHRLAELLKSAKVQLTIVSGAGSEYGRPGVDAISEMLGQGVWSRPDGKPEARIFVSASHAAGKTLAVAAPTRVGCDIETIAMRPSEVWMDLLGREGSTLAKLTALEANEDLQQSYTRVWSALEAVKKTGATISQAPLTLDRVEQPWVIFRAGGGLSVPTWAGPIGDDESTMNLIAVAVDALPDPSWNLPSSPPPLAEKPSSRTASELELPSYSYEHVVGFQDTNFTGNVYFVNHLEWQGRCREMFLRDKAPSVVEDLSHGLAIVTTRCACEYLLELKPFDTVRIEMRLKSLFNTHLELRFQYWRKTLDAEELVATGSQELAFMRVQEGLRVMGSVPVALREALEPYRM